MLLCPVMCVVKVQLFPMFPDLMVLNTVIKHTDVGPITVDTGDFVDMVVLLVVFNMVSWVLLISCLCWILPMCYSDTVVHLYSSTESSITVATWWEEMAETSLYPHIPAYTVVLNVSCSCQLQSSYKTQIHIKNHTVRNH